MVTNGSTAAWVKLAGTAGATAAIALYLVWQLATWLPEHSREEAAHFRRLERLLMKICLNTSPDSAARSECLDDGGDGR